MAVDAIAPTAIVFIELRTSRLQRLPAKTSPDREFLIKGKPRAEYGIQSAEIKERACQIAVSDIKDQPIKRGYT